MRECLLLCLTFLLLLIFIDKMTLNRTFIILRIKVILGFPPRDNGKHVYGHPGVKWEHELDMGSFSFKHPVQVAHKDP